MQVLDHILLPFHPVNLGEILPERLKYGVGDKKQKEDKIYE
jgi:hypothetical protein